MSDAPRLRRTDKEMSDAAARDMLARGHAGRLATVSADGWRAAHGRESLAGVGSHDEPERGAAVSMTHGAGR